MLAILLAAAPGLRAWGVAAIGPAPAVIGVAAYLLLPLMRGIGLEQNAVVIVHQPDVGNAWVNVGYAGFVNGDTGASLGGTLAFATDATPDPGRHRAHRELHTCQCVCH